MSEDTINIRVFRATRDRLKVKAAQAKMSMVEYIDLLSKFKK